MPDPHLDRKWQFFWDALTLTGQKRPKKKNYPCVNIQIKILGWPIGLSSVQIKIQQNRDQQNPCRPEPQTPVLTSHTGSLNYFKLLTTTPQALIISIGIFKLPVYLQNCNMYCLSYSKDKLFHTISSTQFLYTWSHSSEADNIEQTNNLNLPVTKLASFLYRILMFLCYYFTQIPMREKTGENRDFW